MNRQISALTLLICVGVINGLSQVIMRWAGKGIVEPFSLSNLGPWLFASRWWLLGLGLSWTTGMLWAVMLKKVPLAIALPLFTGSVYVVTLLGAFVFLAERPSQLQISGIVLTVSGIALMVVAK